MTFAALGISISETGLDETPGKLNKVEKAALGVERATDALPASTSRAGAGIKRLGDDTRTTAGALERLAMNSLTGFNAIAARAGQQAEYVARQIAKMSMTDIRGEDIAAYGAELDRLKAKYNPAFAASQAYGRELDEINYAHKVGAISAREQASAIAMLDAQYRAAASSADIYQSSAMRAQKAGPGAAGANMTNLMFQGQDIAMMTLTGQAPGMLALQQGMQVGGIFSQMGSGKAVVQGLTGALTMMLNPLNLATILAIGLGAAGVQAFMAMMGSTEDASSALERHNEFLDKTLAGYGGVRDAADAALEAALKLPQDSVESDLGAKRADAANSAVDALQKALQLRKEFEAYAGYAEAFRVPAEDVASLKAANDVIADVTSDAALSRQELDQMHTALTELGNNTADQNIKDIVNEALALVDAARQAFAQVDSLDTALRNIPRDIQIRLQVSQEFTSSMGELSDLYVDPRSRFEVAREQAKNLADQATATAASYGDLVGVGEEYQRVLASINAAEAEASQKTGAAAAKAAAKPFDQWGGNVDSFRQRIAAQQMEIELLGQSTYEIERQRAAFELLNQAKEAGIPITAEVTDQINQMSADFAAATVELQMQQQAMSMIENAATSVADAWKDGKIELSEMLDIAMNLVGQFMQMSKLGGTGGGMGGIGDFLSMIFGGGGGGGGLKPGYNLPGYAGGTDNYPGGWARMNEQGGEIVKLPSGTVIMPHDISRSAANSNSRGISVQTNIINNAGVEVIENTTDDGQGGVRQEIVLNRAVANAIGKPGPSQRAVRSTGQLVRR